MGIIEGYILFCLTTAIVAIIQLYRFVHKKLKETHKENIVALSPIKACIFFGIYTFITAPIMIFVLLVPSISIIFINAMYEGLIS